MEKLARAEQKFAEELPPIEALRAWLLLFVDYIAAKQLIALRSTRWWVIQRKCSRLPTHGSGKRFAHW